MQKLIESGPSYGSFAEYASPWLTSCSQQELQLACTLIDSAHGPVDWPKLADDTPQKLAQLIEAKLEGREVTAAEEEPTEVLQLLDALKQSVNKGSADADTSKIRKSVRPHRGAAVKENTTAPNLRAFQKISVCAGLLVRGSRPVLIEPLLFGCHCVTATRERSE